MKQRQIFAIGGRFYVDTWQPPLLQRHLLSLTPAPSPKICLLAGAVGDNPAAIEQFYREIGQHVCRPAHLNIYKPVTRDFADYFAAMDIIYVNGGSTRNLITVWRDWGIDGALRTAWEQGVVMSGTSAGMNCWFEACITDSYPPEMLPLDCIGLLAGSACAHYSTRPDRAPTFRRMIADATIPARATPPTTTSRCTSSATTCTKPSRRDPKAAPGDFRGPASNRSRSAASVLETSPGTAQQASPRFDACL